MVPPKGPSESLLPASKMQQAELLQFLCRVRWALKVPKQENDNVSCLLLGDTEVNNNKADEGKR